MRYGKSTGVHAIDPHARRKQGMTLKKAQPGAPFGWTSEGTPYSGTQYCVDFRTPTGRLASLSTRNGGEAYHWQSLGGVSAKVASSALETHGRIDQLMAGESGRPCGEILSASDLATVRAAFVRVLGEEVVRQFEVAGEEAGEAEVKSEEAKSEVKREVKAEAGKAEAGREAETSMDKKRKARMALFDARQARNLEGEGEGPGSKQPKSKRPKAEASGEAAPVD